MRPAVAMPDWFELHIINALPNNNIPLWFHCASGNKDFGYQILNAGDDFHFEFGMNALRSTLYFSHFWWGDKQNVFDIFNKHLADHCSDTKTHYCYWKVQIDGFYMGPQLDQLSLMHSWEK